ncbi:major facilitator superfamily domain-containing protein [Scleroderma yunnanense]
MTGSSGIILADEDGIVERGHWAGVARVLGPPWARFPSLTIGLLGVQVLWSVEMSYASPYLVSLGLSKSGMAAVFLAGPLSGLIVQPLIGILADNSKSRFGRRRPLILAGAVLCSCATLLLGYTKPIASIFAPSGSLTHNVYTIWLAILAIYCIDFSINAVQALDRALLVDTLPTSEQPNGNAWAACMLAIGSVVGFYVGNINLPALFPFLGNVQLEVIAVIASVLLIGTHLWTAWSVKERILLSTHAPVKTLRQEVAELWHTFRHLPQVIYRICIIQFFSWLAWFPVLFYTSLYIGELYKRSLPSVSAADVDVDAEATRLGSRTLFYSALVSLVSNIVAPAFVFRSEPGADKGMVGSDGGRWWSRVPRIHLATLWAISHAVFVACMGATYFTTSVSGATFVMALTGFCWAITQWAPFALLAEAILSHHSATPARTNTALEEPDLELDSGDAELTPIHRRNHAHPWQSFEEEQDLVRSRRESIEGGEGRRLFQERWEQRASEDEGEQSNNVSGSRHGTRRRLSAQAGAILGIHNIFIVIPQFLVTGLSSLIFALLDPKKSVLHGHHPGSTLPAGAPGNGTVSASLSIGVHFSARDEDGETNGPNAIAVIFWLGGIASAVAFMLTCRLAREQTRTLTKLPVNYSNSP